MQFKRFADFYPYYLSEHCNPICRRLHFIGSLLIILLVLYVLVSRDWPSLWYAPLLGYGFAWIGHVFFEHNRPATFRHPLYSLLGDWVMFRDIITGRIRF